MINSKPTTWFWVVAVIALLWNLMGLGAFMADMMMSPETLAETYPPDQLAFLETYPSWTKIFYGLATVGGFLGCIGLLLRKRWALGMFVLSLFGVVVQQAHSIFLTNAVEVFGNATAIYFPVLILVIAIFMIWFTKNCITKGVLP